MFQKYEGVERICSTCENCMCSNEGHLVCAGGYEKSSNKEPYYGQRIYNDEIEKYLEESIEKEENDDYCPPMLSDKFNGNCPCWDISFDSFVYYCKKNNVRMP